MEGSQGVRKGAWSKFEDDLLKACVQQFGEGKWHLVPQRTRLNRCRKSCRLRWLNYLKPNIKRGDFSEDEVDLMFRLHKLLGNRWSLIAGRLPGRTANDVKNYWNTHMRSKVVDSQAHSKKEDKQETEIRVKPQEVIKPLPRTFSKASSQGKLIIASTDQSGSSKVSISSEGASSSEKNWWETLLELDEDNTTFSLAEGNHLWDDSKVCDFLTQGQTWSDFLFDVNL